MFIVHKVHYISTSVHQHQPPFNSTQEIKPPFLGRWLRRHGFCQGLRFFFGWASIVAQTELMMVVKAPPFREAPPTKKPSMLGCCPDPKTTGRHSLGDLSAFTKRAQVVAVQITKMKFSPMPKSIEVGRKRTTANFKQNHMLLLVTAFSSPPNMFIFHQLRPLNLSSFNEIIQPHPSIFDRFTSRLQGPRHRVPLRSCRSQSHHTGYARTR